MYLNRTTRWLGAALIAALALPAAAQGLFSPAISINDRAITYYEIDQRAAFLRLLRAPGDLQELAVEQLIDDRLRLDAADDLGITLTDEGLELALSEFAGRANLSTEAFLEEIAKDGISSETYRDFVLPGTLWREVVRTRFGARGQVSEAEIDRALALSSRPGGARVLMSEVILPATPDVRDQSEARAQQISQITGFDAFASAARQYSASASRARGGRIDWLDVSNLPPQIRGQVLTLTPGETTGPIRLENAIAVFQLRALEETDVALPQAVAVEYASFLIPGGQSSAAFATAAEVQTRVDTCDDLYGVAKDLPEERLDRVVLPLDQIPPATAMELAKLDEGEISTALTTNDGQALIFLMLCGRTLEISEAPSREDIASQLRNARLGSYADSFLAELRADAYIVYADESLRPSQ